MVPQAACRSARRGRLRVPAGVTGRTPGLRAADHDDLGPGGLHEDAFEYVRVGAAAFGDLERVGAHKVALG